MAHVIGQSFEVVIQATSGGFPAGGLVAADFALGVVQLRLIDPLGASPAPVALDATAADFAVEETFALSGQYALKFTAGVAPAVAGIYSVRIAGGAGVIDEQLGVLKFEEHDPAALAAWLAGKNTVGIVADEDSEGNPTHINVYGFDTATDAELYLTNPSAYGSLVRIVIVENYIYEVSTGRPDKYIRKVP